MAASEGVPIHFAEICENSFYFTCIDVDSFRFSRESKGCWIQSRDRKFLVLESSGEFEFQERNSEERKQADCQFNLRIYQDSSTTKRQQPVILYAHCQSGAMVVCCRDNKVVCPENMDLGRLRNIDGTGHKALFYRRKVSCDKYMFESTLYEGRFLAFEHQEEMFCQYKLILRPKELDEVDESCEMVVSESKK